MSSGDEITFDSIFDGEVVLAQHRGGYRFGMDALLLATDLPEHAPDATIVELGAAHGPVALVVARRNPQARVVAVERQASLFALLERNIASNRLDNVEAVFADVREHRRHLRPHTADLVLCNPPYFRPGQRRMSTNAERAEARHEVHGELDDFLLAARYALKPGGYLKMILPPLRLGDVFSALETLDLRLESLRFFHTRAHREAYLVEYVLRRGGAPDFVVRPPLYIYASEGIYSDEVAARLGKRVRHR